MSWFTDLFTGGIDKVIGSVGDVIDSLSTTDEEKLEAKLKLEKEINNFKKFQLNSIAAYDKEITTRHKTDMKSDSWLSKNIRPLALAFLTITTMVLVYCTIFILEPSEVELVKPWISLLTTLDITAFGFYFGGRTLEKRQKVKNDVN